MEIVRTSVRRLAHRSPSSFRTAGALVSANLFQFHNAILSAPGQIAVEAVARVFSRINAPQQQSRSKFEKVDEVRRNCVNFVCFILNMQVGFYSGAVKHRI